MVAAEVLVTAADLLEKVVSASDVVDQGASVVDGEPGVLGVVVAGGPLLALVWGLADGVIDTSVGVVEGPAVHVWSFAPEVKLSSAAVDDVVCIVVKGALEVSARAADVTLTVL